MKEAPLLVGSATGQLNGQRWSTAPFNHLITDVVTAERPTLPVANFNR
jgi:hypothetical protein